MSDNTRPDIPAIVTTDLSSTIDDPHVEFDVSPPTPSDHGEHHHFLTPSPSYYLSPGRRSSVSGHSSLDASYSPTLSPTLGPRSASPSYAGSLAGSSQHVPPSPTLSAHSSVHLASALALRDNKPDQRDGLSSLHLLAPDRAHRRKGSIASSLRSDATEPDAPFVEFGMVSVSTARHDDDWRAAPAPGSSVPPSPTHTHFDSASASEFDDTTLRSRSGSAHSRVKLIAPNPPDARTETPSRKGKGVGGGGGNGVENENEDGNEHDGGVKGVGHGHGDAPRPALDLSADDAIDAGPFAFKPYRLASLVDPKSLLSLEQMGGAAGLLRGLGTHARNGLSARAIEKAHDSRPGPGTEPGVGDDAGQRHDRQQDPGGLGLDLEDGRGAAAVPGIVVTGPGSEVDVSVERDTKSRVRDDQATDEEADARARDASLDERRRVFGANVLPSRKTKSLPQLMWLALKDKVLVLLSIAAVVSLALGFFQDFGTPRPAGEPPVDWVEGVAIIVAILIVVLVGSINDWQKERQFQALNEKKEERGVKVVRAGVEHVVDVHEVVVGDIALLEPGEIVPCDGVFLGGHNVRCDESGATGESDAIRKIDYEEALRARDGHGEHASAHADCFMVSGSKVLEGYGSYVVIAVGPKSFNGRIMMALRGDTEDTPLQLKLNRLAELIAKAGSVAGLALFVALMIRFFVQLGTNNPARTANQKGIAFVNILIISVTLIVVAVPEGLPLAVTLALAFATKRMTKENLLVRVLGSCETMANASVVCTDKTGTLTQNSMTVVAGTVGIHCKFVRDLAGNRARTNAAGEGEPRTGDRPAEEVVRGARPGAGAVRKHSHDFSVDQAELNACLPGALCALLNAAITVNSTAFEDEDAETGARVFVGSKTETALLGFARELGWADYRATREAAEVVQMIPFSSARKAMGVVVRIGEGRWRVYLKGASEILTKQCARYVSVARPGPGQGEERELEVGGSGSGDEDGVETREMDELANDNVTRTIIFYANQTLRTIALCYRDFESWPPADSSCTPDDEVEYEDLARDLTLIAITGIEDPLREGVRDAVGDCFKAGVTVKMCTGDNVLTARSIALQCGIFSEGGLIMEGPVFRKLSDQELLEVVPRLQVLARSSPDDKQLLVEKLRELGEIVGVTGDGTNDGPALKTADVGFSMGVAGTEVAKEASDIILMDDNFSSIVKAIMWGRCVNDAVRKFLQFQISTNVTAVIVTFVSAVASASESSVLSAVQLLWINIIMDTFAALALATDPASPALLGRKPDKKTAPLFSVEMYKQIMGQSTYQTIVVLLFHFLGARILAFDPNYSSTVAQTVVFNIFVFAQIANSVNCRRLDSRLNIFEGISRNYYFMGITAIEIAVQVLIVFVGGAAFSVTRIGGAEWGISLALGMVSIPLGVLIRCLPSWPVERLLIALRLFPNPEALPTTRPDNEGWNAAIELVRDNLNTFAHVRGGRMRASSYVDRSRKARPVTDTHLPLSSIMTMVPTLVASSIGRAPLSPSGLSDPAHFDPSKSSAALWEGRIQVHPDTKPDDPARTRWAGNDSPC